MIAWYSMVFDDAKWPKAFTIDCCFAELQAIITLLTSNVMAYLRGLFRYFDDDTTVPTEATLVFFCLNHLVKDLSRLLTRRFGSNIDAEVKKFILRCFGLLQAAKNRRQAFKV